MYLLKKQFPTEIEVESSIQLIVEDVSEQELEPDDYDSDSADEEENFSESDEGHVTFQNYPVPTNDDKLDASRS